MDLAAIVPLAVSVLTAMAVAYEAIARRREAGRSLTVEEGKLEIQADTFAVHTYRDMVDDLVKHVKEQETLHRTTLQRALDLKAQEIEQLRRELLEMRRLHEQDTQEIAKLKARIVALEQERAQLLRKLEAATPRNAAHI